MAISRRNVIKMLAGTVPAISIPKAFAATAPFIDPGNGTDGQPAILSVARKYNFNPGWKVWVGDPQDASAPGYDDHDWRDRTMPYAWNEDDAFSKDIAQLSTGIAWYRKHFKLPAWMEGKKIFLEFEGIRQAGTFYLNGKQIGLSENGVMAFGFDISNTAHYGDETNVLAARIDNSWDYREVATHTKFQWEDRNFYANYGGINKNVFLHVTGKLYQTLPLYVGLGTTGIYVYTDQFDIAGKKATLHASSEVRNELDHDEEVQYEVEVRDMEGRPVKRFTGDRRRVKPMETVTLGASAVLTGLHFWSWGYGYLYEVRTRLLVDGKAVDEVLTRTGFRKTAFTNGMIYLNDRVIQIHGYGQRTTNEWPAIGLSVPAWLSDYSNGLMVAGNANLVRWMHVTPWKQDVESCDRVGLLQAMPAGDSEGDVKDIRWEQRKALMQQAIIYNRNNPSILFYECGNKGIMDSQMQQMKDIRDQYDPHGGRAIGAREMLASPIAEYGGEMLYIDKSATKPLWAMEYSRDEGLREYWDDYTPPYHKDGDGPPYKGESAAIYNRNMQSHAVENVRRWFDYWEARPGTGTRVSSGGVNIIFSDTNTHHRGAENYRCSGEVDAMRIKKENYFANQVMWNGWVDVDVPGIHIIGHWNYYPGVKKDVFVVSTAESVALTVNGRSVGSGERSHRFLFTFKNVPWKPGTLEATGYDAHGRTLCSARKSTVGPPAALRLTEIARPVPFLADGHDLSLVEVEVTDSRGTRCPDALDRIHFDIEGPAEWRGGIAKGPGNFILNRDIPVSGGVNRIFIRSTTQPGEIRVRANAPGLKEAVMTLKSVPFAVADGLSLLLPAQGLPCRTGRGPTPAGPSYHITRVALPIARVKAGANPDRASGSYDDNETTGWENDGHLSTAWIAYFLGKPSMISEIVLKLNRFRTRSYPLEITVDGKTVFRGESALSLGYFTVRFNAVRGSEVKIQLKGSSSEKMAHGEKELSGQTLGDGIGETASHALVSGTLSIIEAEIYGPAGDT